MSNMNMKIIINKNNKVKKTRDSFLLDKSNINKYILPSFTKKYLNQYQIKMKKYCNYWCRNFRFISCKSFRKK